MSEEELHLESRGSHGPSFAEEANETVDDIASQKALARYLSQDTDLWIFQHFNRLNIFRIVYLQQRLVNLERQLDQAVPDNPGGVWKCDMQAWKWLMPEIESTLKKYGMCQNLSRCRICLMNFQRTQWSHKQGTKLFESPPKDLSVW